MVLTNKNQLKHTVVLSMIGYNYRLSKDGLIWNTNSCYKI